MPVLKSGTRMRVDAESLGNLHRDLVDYFGANATKDQADFAELAKYWIKWIERNMLNVEPNATRTIFRCFYCNVILGAPVVLPADIYAAVACGACNDRINNCEDEIGFVERRDCTCGHALCFHESIDVESAAPSPCKDDLEYEQGCSCKNFVEDYN